MIDRTDEETGEIVREWLERYGLAIILGVVIIIAAIAGYRWWQQKQAHERSLQASYLMTLYDAVNDNKVESAQKAFAQIHSDAELYAFGNLLMARLAHQQHDDKKAIDYLNTAAQAKDKAVADLALWQSAKLKLASGDAQGAETVLQKLKGSLFGKETAGLEGILAQSQGNLGQAATQYHQAAQSGEGSVLFARQAAIVNAALSLDTHNSQGSK